MIGAFILLFKRSNISTIPEISENLREPDNNEYIKVFNKLIIDYGPKIANDIERIYRLETAHFTSGQYKKTYSAGMLKFSDNYPFGWTTPAEKLWHQNPQFSPVGEAHFNKHGKNYTYLKFRDFESAARSLAVYLLIYPRARWNSTDLNNQKIYDSKLDNIKTIYT